MGRWAQSRRRGGGPSTLPLTILGVDVTSNKSATITFSRAVVITAGAGDAAIHINGEPLSTVAAGSSSAKVDVTGPDGSWDGGVVFSSGSQPAWLTTSLAFPQFGVTTSSGRFITRVLVELTLGGLRIQFNVPVNLSGGGDDGSLSVDGAALSGFSGGGTAEIDCICTPVASQAEPWTLSASPSWLADAIAFPADGVTEPA